MLQKRKTAAFSPACCHKSKKPLIRRQNPTVARVEFTISELEYWPAERNLRSHTASSVKEDVMKHPSVLACILTLAATPAFAAGSSHSSSASGSPVLSFDRLDANGDGRISEKEAAMANLTFLDMDANKDGHISKDEFASATGATARASKDTIPFDQVDTNGDGRISEKEASMASLSFLDMDLNKDGSISREEFRTVAGIGETSAARAAAEKTEEATSDQQGATIEPESPDPGSATATG
ncbi:MAG TPA: hypothetical protein VFY81_14400 [Gammaproteobacteria bacterium]|nr:hypothetical protein [Gammaproteobacteria bacterium]